MAKALELSQKHGIDLASLKEDNNNSRKPVVGHRYFSLGQRLPVVFPYVAGILVRHFNVRVVSSGGRETGRYFYIIGAEHDMEIAEYVYEFLSKKMMDLWHAKNLATAHRSDYLLGLYNGLHRKLEAEKQTVQSGLAPDVANKYSIILVDNQAAIARYAADLFSGSRVKETSKSQSVKNSASYLAGVNDGRNININKSLAAPQ